MSVRDQILNTIRAWDDWIFERFGGQKLLFVATDGYGFACQAPVIRELLDKGHGRIRVTTDPGGRLEGPLTFESAEDEALFNELKLPAAVAAVMKWHVVVYSHGCGFYPKRRALRAFLHHGPGFARPEAVLAFDLHFGLSSSEYEYLENAAPGTFGSNRAFFPIGYPATDKLVNDASTPAELLASLDLPVRKTMLLASRWEPPNAMLAKLGAEPFELLAREFPDCNVIQQGHPWLWQRRHALDPAWQDELYESLRDVERRHPNARFLPWVSGTQLVAASDLLVADPTSTVTIAALLDRPVILFEAPTRPIASQPERVPYLEGCDVFSSVEQLPALCRAALNRPEARRDGRAAVANTFFAKPGRAATEMAKALVNIGTVCSTSSSGWTRVLSLSEQALAEQ